MRNGGEDEVVKVKVKVKKVRGCSEEADRQRSNKDAKMGRWEGGTESRQCPMCMK